MPNDPNIEEIQKLFGLGHSTGLKHRDKPPSRGWIGLAVLGTPLRDMPPDEREAYLRQMVAMGPPPGHHKPYGIMRPSIAKPPEAWIGKP